MAAATTFCGACGRALAEGGHDRCADHQRYDPPRFCDACGFRLDVQVYPDHAEMRCRRCAKNPAESG